MSRYAHTRRRIRCPACGGEAIRAVTRWGFMELCACGYEASASRVPPGPTNGRTRRDP